MVIYFPDNYECPLYLTGLKCSTSNVLTYIFSYYSLRSVPFYRTKIMIPWIEEEEIETFELEEKSESKEVLILNDHNQHFTNIHNNI